jgi:raffinose/stachyose/melibiose transport system substrate-binding protein
MVLVVFKDHKKEQKMIKKTVFPIFMLLAAAFVFPGGSKESSVSSGGSTSEGLVEIVNEQTIRWPCIWVGTDSKASSIAALVKEFNTAHAGKIKIVIEESPNYDDYRDKIRTSVVVGSVPDFFTLDQVDMNAFLESDKLLDFGPYLDTAFESGFTPGIFDSVRDSSGKIKVIPYEKAVPVFIYNKALFAKAGYDHFPETFDELFILFDKLKALGIVPTSQMTAANAWTSQLWFSNIIVAIGGPDVLKKQDFNDPAWTKAAELIKTIYDKYTTSDAISAGASVAGGHYLNGQTAILANGTWYFGRLATEGIPGLAANSGVAATPAYTGGKGQAGGFAGSTLAFFAAANTRDPQKRTALVEWVKFLSRPENVKRISLNSGSLFHVNVDLGDDISPLLQQTLSLLNKAPYFTNHFDASLPLAVVNEFPQALSSLVSGDSTPDQFVARLKAAKDRY